LHPNCCACGQGLNEHNIISAPIVTDGKLVGVVDALDIIVSVVRSMTQDSPGEIGQLLWDGVRFADQPVSVVLGSFMSWVWGSFAF
jgi:hypothetical protein